MINVKHDPCISRLYAYGIIVVNDSEKVVMDRVVLLCVYFGLFVSGGIVVHSQS